MSSTETQEKPVVKEKTLQEWQKEYEKLERDVTTGLSFDAAFVSLNSHLTEFQSNQMPEPVKQFFLQSGLPRVISKFLRDPPHFLSAEQYQSTHLTIRRVIDIIIEFGISSNSASLSECLFHIFDPLVPLYIRSKAIPNDPAIPSAAQNPPDGCALVADNINYFANQNGIRAILDQIGTGTTLVFLSNIVNVLWKPVPNHYLLPELVLDMSAHLSGLVSKRLMNLTEVEIRTIKKEEFERLIRNIIEKTSNIVRQADASTAKEFIEDLSLHVAKQCFFSQIFDKRLFALSLFSDWIRSFPPEPTPETAQLVVVRDVIVSEKKFLSWATQNQIISTLFGMSKHVNLIKQSGVFLAFMASKDALSESDLELIVDSVKHGHTSVATEVLQLIGGGGSSLLRHHVNALLDMVRAIDPTNHQLAGPIVQFTGTMALTKLKDFSQRTHFLDILWENVVDEARAPICEQSLTTLFNIFHTCQDFEILRIHWARMLLESAKAGRSVPHCYQLLGHMTSAYPDYYALRVPPQQPEKKENDVEQGKPQEVQYPLSQQEFARILNSEIPILPQFLDSFEAYKKHVRAEIENHNVVDVDGATFGTRLTYREEFAARLSILELYLYLLAPHTLEDCHTIFGRIWDLFVVNAITEAEREFMLGLFMRFRRPYSAIVAGQQIVVSLPDEATSWIFDKLIGLVPTAEQHQMNQTAFNAFQLYFRDTNVLQQKMSVSGSGYVHSCLPSDLIGYQELWNIVLNVSNENVINASIKFLNDLFVYQPGNPASNKKENNSIFISTCLSKINEATSSDQIVRCVSLLNQSISQLEGEGNARELLQMNRPISLTIVNQILKEHLEPVPPVVLGEEYPERKRKAAENDPWWKDLKNKNEIVLHVHNNMTVYQLATLILNTLQASPGGEIYKGLKSQDLILEILNPVRDDSESILTGPTVNKSLEYNQVNSDTIIGLSVESVIAGRETKNRRVSEWKAMSPKETNEPSDVDKRVKRICEIYQLSPEVAKMALKDNSWSVDLTAAAILANPGRVTGYIDEASKKNNNGAPPPTPKRLVDAENLSSIISTNQGYFETLFQLFKTCDSVRPLLSSLFLRLSPAAHIYHYLIDEPDWTRFLFDPTDTHSVLYQMQIIDSCLFSPVEPSDEDKEKRLRWVSSFTGDLPLQRLVQASTAQLKALQVQMKHKFIEQNSQKTQMECLARLLRSAAFVIESRNASPQELIKVNGLYGTFYQSSAHPIQFELDIAHQFLETLLKSLLCVTIESYNYGDNTIWSAACFSYSWRIIGNLLTSVTEEQIPQMVASFLSLIKSFEVDPIKETLLNPHVLKICDAFGSGLSHVLEVSAHKASLSEVSNFFFDYLLSIFPNAEAKDISLMYFHLLVNHLERFQQDPSKKKVLDPLALQLVDALINENISEKTGLNRTLNGRLKILSLLLKGNSGLVASHNKLFEDFVHHLHTQFLFKIEMDSNGSIIGPKANTRSTRSEAFQLVYTLCEADEHFYKKVIELVYGHIDNMNQAPTSWHHQRGKQKSETGFVGLKNLSCTCYMNSLLQQFFNIEPIRQGILTVDPSESLRKNPSEDNMLVQLQIVFGFLKGSVMHHHDPVAFFNTYKDMDGKPVSKSQQQDVDEYFNRTCSELERLLQGTNYSALFTAEFGVVLTNEIKSSDPQYPWFSENPETFLCLPLDVKGKSSLEQALNAMVAVDHLEGDNAYMCEKYSRTIDATKRYSIKSLSNMLAFSLKRFDYDVNFQRKVKINDYLNFPKQLNMRPWTQEGLHGDESEFQKREDWYYEYVLVGVLVHNGHAEGGHYYSYIKTAQNDWLEFNDSDVRPFNINNLEAECYGGKQWVDWDKSKAPYEKAIEKSAYMLFYQRVKREPITDYSIDPTKPKPKEEQPEKPKEEIVPVPFVNGLPEKIHEMVWIQNREFLRNQYLFDPAYFDFLLSLSYLLPVTQHQKEFNSNFIRHLEFSIKFVFQILVHTSSQNVFSTWSLIFTRIFRLDRQSASRFLLYCLKRIGEEKEKPEPKDFHEHLLKKMLLDCPSERVRIGFSNILLSALDSVSAWESTTEDWPLLPAENKLEYPVNQSIACFVWRALQNMIEISRNHWMAFKQYWDINYYSVQLGLAPRRYFRDLVLVFSDYKQYYMNCSGMRRQYSNVSIMDDQYHADLRAYIDTLRILVCGSHNEQAEEIEATGVKLSEEEKEALRTPYSVPGPLLPPLEKHHKDDIFDYSFFSSMMEMEYNIGATIQIIQHISWNCPERSKWSMLSVLEEFDKVMQHKQFALCAILGGLLQIKDDLQPKRVSWAMSPFPIANSKHQTNNYSHSGPKTTGLLGHLKNQPKFVIQLLMHLQTTNPEVREYLRDRRSELLWMRDSIISTLENEKLPVPLLSDEDLKEIEVIPPPARTEATPFQALYRSLCGLIRLGGTGSSDNGEILELLRKMEVLEADLRKERQEHEKTKNSLEYVLDHFKKVANDVPPPQEIDLSMISDGRDGWKKKKEAEHAEEAQGQASGQSNKRPREEDDENQATYGPNPPPNVSGEDSPPLLLTNGPANAPNRPTNAPPSSPEPGDLPLKIASLKEILPHLSDRVLKVALRHHNWNPDTAVMALFDPDKEAEYCEEALSG